MIGFIDDAASLLVVFALHSTCWLLIGLGASALLRDRALALQELLLRLSLVAGLVTSFVQWWSGIALWGLQSTATTANVPGAVPLAMAPEPILTVPASSSFFEEDLVAALPTVSDAATWSPAVLVLSLAAAFAVLGCVWLLEQRRRLHSALSAREPERDPRLLSIAAEAATHHGLTSSPRLSRCSRIGSPVAFGVLRPEVSVPARTAELGDAQLRALFGHELAHIVRADAAWLWLAAVLQALAPWQLLMVPARRRLHVIAELRCDAAAVRCTGAVAVAECLVQFAQWVEQSRASRRAMTGALAMAARPSVLRRRVEAALAERPDGHVRRGAAALLCLALLFVFTAAAPGLARIDTAALAEVRSDEPRELAPPLSGPTTEFAGELAPLLAQCLYERDRLNEECTALRASMVDVRDDPELGRLLDLLEVRMSLLNESCSRLQRGIEAVLEPPMLDEARSER